MAPRARQSDVPAPSRPRPSEAPLPLPADDLLLAPPWEDPGEPSAEAHAIASALGLSLTIADALSRTGFAPGDELQRFLNPRLNHLSPPDAMLDRDAAAERLVAAIKQKERIVVFGDYDCDGITSVAILTTVLRHFGATVVPLLATRRDGAYGLSTPALARVMAAKPTVVVTCDCGSSDHDRIAELGRRGIDTVVIDHHLVPETPLPALAFLNPHRPECGFPFKGLASCGLALSVAAAIRQKLGVEFDLRPLLDLVAIGTIADVAPLNGDNRPLVRAGLEVLRNGSRPGLAALCALAKLELKHAVCAEDIAFKIAPRMNAPGRLGDPDLTLELLLAPDFRQAQVLAASIEGINNERKALQARAIAEAQEQIRHLKLERAAAIVVASRDWPYGIVGIVAGRLASHLNRPVVAASIEGERVRGSVRAHPGFRIYDALHECRSVVTGFGGHQAAAGVEVELKHLDTFREAFASAAEAAASATPSVLQEDGPSAVFSSPVVRWHDRDASDVVLRDLAALEPCGEANRAPEIVIMKSRVLKARDLKGHLKLELARGGASLSAFGPDLGSFAPKLEGRNVDVRGRLRRDDYRGNGAVELKIERIRLATEG